MSTPATSRSAALTLSLAATLAFFGSALMLHAGRALSMFGGVHVVRGRAGAPLLAIVLLLAVTGALLLALAAHALLHAPRPHPARDALRRHTNGER